MRIHILACRVLSRELSHYAAISPHTVELTWLPQGLHDTPDKLRASLAQALVSLYDQREQGLLQHWPDVIALGYGLCSNGILGLESRDTPLVIPRTDDCIALFLGSQGRYLELFGQYNGCYWLNNGWIEHGLMVHEMNQGPRGRAARRQEYADLYGEENADFLMEHDDGWKRNYNTCGFIHSPVYASLEYEALAQRFAQENGWGYATLEGDNRMIRLLTEGGWDEQEFLICPPYHRIEASYDGSKIQAVPLRG